MPRELWAKVAVEIVRDPKLLARSPWERWLWLGLICLTKENANGDGILHGYNPRLLASVLDLPVKAAKVRAALDAFAAAGMVRLHADDAIELVHFKKRQEAGLNGTREQAKERKERWKERQRNGSGTIEVRQGTEPERPANVIEEEEEEEEEEEKEKKEQKITAQSAEKPPPAPASPFVLFVREEWRDLKNPAAFEGRARKAFPAIDPLAEARKARGWELADPSHTKRKHGPFFWNWLTTAQDRTSKNGAQGIAAPNLHVDNDALNAEPNGRKML